MRGIRRANNINKIWMKIAWKVSSVIHAPSWCEDRCILSYTIVMICHDLDDVLRKSMMMSSKGNIFRIAGRMWWESTGNRWIPRRTASDAKPLLWSAPERTVG